MSAEALRDRLRAIVTDLRLGHEGAAGQALGQFLVELHTELGGTGLEAPHMVDLLQTLLGAQERADLIALADGLEYDLAPHLPR